jgi:tetratricopeptide (TPR) repeat protein
MADDVVRTLRERYDQINALLDRAHGPAELDAAKRDIIAFFKHVDGLVAELAALKEEIRQLVDRYKQLADERRASAAAPEFPGEKPVVHADHIGASTFIQKGWSLLSLGDYQGATQALTRALELSPNEIEAESLLGWAQMLGEDYDGALGTFQKVLMREPANSLARINVGYICYKKRIFGEAIEHLSKAIRMANDKKATLYAHFYLGLVYLEREMYEDAESFFRKAIELGPNMTEAFFELGRTQWFGGDPGAARATWQAGVSTSKFSPGGKKCQRMLERVEAGGAPPKPGADALD